MIVLTDTNIVLRMVERNHSDHQVAMTAVRALLERSYTLVIVPQVVYEFWVVATRPKEVNGLGMAPLKAMTELNELLPFFRLLKDERSIYDHWLELVSQHSVIGKHAHDARIVAAMQRHRVTRLLTFNASDFARFGDIQIINPNEGSLLPALE